MSEPLADLVWGTGWLLLGSAILMNTERLARLDLSANDRMRLWLDGRLGANSIWNYKFFSAPAENRFRNSKIGFRIFGIFCLVLAFMYLSIFLMSYFR